MLYKVLVLTANTTAQGSDNILFLLIGAILGLLAAVIIKGLTAIKNSNFAKSEVGKIIGQFIDYDELKQFIYQFSEQTIQKVYASYNTFADYVTVVVSDIGKHVFVEIQNRGLLLKYSYDDVKIFIEPAVKAILQDYIDIAKKYYNKLVDTELSGMSNGTKNVSLVEDSSLERTDLVEGGSLEQTDKE